MKRELAALETTSSSIQRETRSNKRVGGSASEVSERLVYTRVKKKSTAVRVRKPELFSNGGGDGGSNGVVEVSETSEVVGEPNDVKEAVIGSPEVDVKDADDFSEMAFEETDVLLKDVEVKDEVVFEDQGLTTSSKGDSEGVDFPKGGNAETVDEVDGNGDEVVEEVSTKAALVAVNGKGKKKRPVEGYPRRFTRSALKSKVDTVTLDKNVVDSKAVTSESNGEVCKEIVVYSETLTTETDESNERVKKKTTETYTRRATRSAKKPKMDDIDLCIVEPVPSDIEKPVPVILDSEKAVPATSSEDVGCDVDKVSKEPSSATTRRKLEMKMSKQISLAKVPTSVQELFETGLLEGCPVYYDKGKGLKLNGRVRGIGILCFCALCKGCKVIPPSVFEIHAIDKYKRAVEYIYLENGRSLIKVLKACKSTRLNTLEATVQNAIGPLPEKKFFVCQNCKEAFFSMDAESSEPVCSKCVMLNLSPIGPVYSSRKRCRSSKFVFPSQAASTYDMVHDSSPENSVGKSSKPALSPKPSKSTFVGKSLLGNASAKLPRSREELLTPQPSKTLSALKSSEKNSGKITRKDIRLHKLVFEDDVLPDGTELGYYARGQKLLDGHKKGFGIFCNCCNAVVSASQFEAHAGCASRRKPYCYIYTSNGVSLHELSITLIKDHRYSVKYNDDLCSICADGGSLLLCDGCPRAFHMECASLPSIPRGKWYCKYCQNMLVRGNFVAYNANALAAGRITGVDSIEQIIKRSIRIVNNLASEVSACILCRGFDFCKSGFGPRTIILCDQCEKEYHVGCLKDHNMADLTELPDGKWFCSMECGRIEYSLENLLARGVKKLPESLLDIIQKKNLQICSDSGTDFEVSWRLLSGKIASPETRPWLSQAVAIFHESFAPIIDVVSRNDLIPAMVYGRNVGGQEYGGMYCAVLTANKVVVSAGIFRIFGPEVAELPLVATSSGNHGKGYFQTLFACIERLLAFLNIKTLVLPAAEEAVSIWTDRFGFTQMTLDQIRELKMNFWSLVQFQGTSMLHKLVPKCHYLENLGE